MGSCCGGGYNYGWQGGGESCPSYGGTNVFVLIVVLFILLIIVGAVIC
mgnify:FL=1